MKQYIRTLSFDDPELSNNIKDILKSYGFYVLSIGNDLEVYAIKQREYLEDKIINWFKGE